MKNFIFGSIFALVLVGIGAGAYFLGKSNNILPKSSPTPVAIPDQETSANLEVLQTPIPLPTGQVKLTKAEMKTKIQTAISTKNYQSLTPYMLPTLTVRKEASGCCGELTPDKAISEMSYLNQALPPWVFDDTNNTIKTLRATYPDYYGINAIVGLSSDGQLVSILLDSDNMIKAVSMAISSDILLP